MSTAQPGQKIHIFATPALQLGAVLVIQGQRLIYDGSIKGPWIQEAQSPGAIVIMDPENKLRVDAAIAKSKEGSPIV